MLGIWIGTEKKQQEFFSTYRVIIGAQSFINSLNRKKKPTYATT